MPFEVLPLEVHPREPMGEHLFAVAGDAAPDPLLAVGRGPTQERGARRLVPRPGAASLEDEHVRWLERLPRVEFPGEPVVALPPSGLLTAQRFDDLLDHSWREGAIETRPAVVHVIEVHDDRAEPAPPYLGSGCLGQGGLA